MRTWAAVIRVWCKEDGVHVYSYDVGTRPVAQPRALLVANLRALADDIEQSGAG
jgi:hypothetical protein